MQPCMCLLFSRGYPKWKKVERLGVVAGRDSFVRGGDEGEMERENGKVV